MRQVFFVEDFEDLPAGIRNATRVIALNTRVIPRLQSHGVAAMCLLDYAGVDDWDAVHESLGTELGRLASPWGDVWLHFLVHELKYEHLLSTALAKAIEREQPERCFLIGAVPSLLSECLASRGVEWERG